MPKEDLNNPCFDKVKSIYEFKVVDLEGKVVKLDKYENRVCLVVNTATNSPLTNIYYKEFNDLVDKFQDKAFSILAFPCNQFDNEDPCNSSEIAAHAAEHNVKFDIFRKVDVNGKDASPVFKYIKLALGSEGTVIKGSYTKFLTNKRGQPVERFEPRISPINLVKNIEKFFATC